MGEKPYCWKVAAPAAYNHGHSLWVEWATFIRGVAGMQGRWRAEARVRRSTTPVAGLLSRGHPTPACPLPSPGGWRACRDYGILGNHSTMAFSASYTFILQLGQSPPTPAGWPPCRPTYRRSPAPYVSWGNL